eukprot:6983165-Lingulodinium_polyedra.AAC.1
MVTPKKNVKQHRTKQCQADIETSSTAMHGTVNYEEPMTKSKATTTARNAKGHNASVGAFACCSVARVQHHFAPLR